MKRNRTKTISTGALLMIALCATLLGSAVVPGVAVAQVTEANVGQMMASAKTPADHQALADYFKAQAANAAQKVKEHETWLSDLKKSGSGGGKAYANSLAHCQTLIASYRKLQKSYEAMAEEHSKATMGK